MGNLYNLGSGTPLHLPRDERMTKNRFVARRGFSMVELLVVVVIVTIVSIGISRMMNMFFKSTKNLRTSVAASGFLADAVPLKKASQAWVQSLRDSGNPDVQKSGLPELLANCLPVGEPAKKAECEEFMTKTPGFRLAGQVPPKVRSMATGKE